MVLQQCTIVADEPCHGSVEENRRELKGIVEKCIGKELEVVLELAHREDSMANI
jgi:hypothetical protein